MKQLFFITSLLVLVILYSSLNYESFEDTYILNPDKISKYSEEGDNKSIKFLNKFLKSEEMQEDCNKLYEKCGNKLLDCSADSLGIYVLCTQQGYDTIIKKIENGEQMYSNTQFINKPLNKRIDGSTNNNEIIYNHTINTGYETNE